MLLAVQVCWIIVSKLGDFLCVAFSLENIFGKIVQSCSSEWRICVNLWWYSFYKYVLWILYIKKYTWINIGYWKVIETQLPFSTQLTKNGRRKQAWIIM